MEGFIVVILVGIACIALGISNTKGNLDTLHYYHRHRVSEEDQLLLGQTVGCGMIIFGLSIVVPGVLFIVTLLTGSPVFTRIGAGIIIAGFAPGIGLCFYAKKYNKEIFEMTEYLLQPGFFKQKRCDLLSRYHTDAWQPTVNSPSCSATSTWRGQYEKVN